jgi:hypothetical protein
LQDTPKFTQIGIFGLKICHLATLKKKAAEQTFGKAHLEKLSGKKTFRSEEKRRPPLAFEWERNHCQGQDLTRANKKCNNKQKWWKKLPPYPHHP